MSLLRQQHYLGCRDGARPLNYQVSSLPIDHFTGAAGLLFLRNLASHLTVKLLQLRTHPNRVAKRCRSEGKNRGRQTRQAKEGPLAQGGDWLGLTDTAA